MPFDCLATFRIYPCKEVCDFATYHNCGRLIGESRNIFDALHVPGFWGGRVIIAASQESTFLRSNFIELENGMDVTLRKAVGSM